MKNFFLTNFNILFSDKFKLPLATLKLQDTTIPEIIQKLIILKGGIKDIKKNLIKLTKTLITLRTPLPVHIFFPAPEMRFGIEYEYWFII